MGLIRKRVFLSSGFRLVFKLTIWLLITLTLLTPVPVLAEDMDVVANCPVNWIDCGNGRCVYTAWICDNADDCGNMKDEENCRDACYNSTCQQKCRATPKGAECYCNPGYELQKDGGTCSDINECSQEGFCSHRCTNTIGGYSCSCLDGYFLEDNRTCLAKGPEPLLVFATSQEIKGILLRTQKYFLIHKSMVSATALDVDLKDSRLYWSEVSRQGAAIYSCFLDGSGLKTVINNGLLIPEGVAVDSIGRNLYITDSGLKQVLVCKIDGSFCSVLHEDNVDKPRSIKLDPSEGLMYWTDWGKDPGIFRSGMDGSGRRTFVSTGIQWPNGIAIDHTTNRLYWCDAMTFRIEYVTLDGKTRKVILQEQGMFHPYSLSVFEDTIYWTDWKKFSVDSCSKFNGHNRKIIAGENGKQINAVHVYHPVLEKSVSNPCWSTLCSHMCVLSPSGKQRCLCPPGFYLASDKVTCRNDSTDNCGFRCRSEHCVPVTWRCDGERDCPDGSDEENCTQGKACPESEFACPSGVCLNKSVVCDGKKDCPGGEDEGNHCGVKQNCPEDEFQCKNGRCINYMWKCDSTNDCGDFSDEENCTATSASCKIAEFQCQNEICIDKALVCDHRDDCQDNSDEEHCDYNNTCKEGMFRCDDGLCIYDHEICDGSEDCESGEDEKNCKTACEDFTCNSGECLNWADVCNGIPDCFDYTDEGDLCATSCGKGNGGCSHLCVATPSGPKCSCLSGFRLQSNGKTCEDEDECLVPTTCSQYCTNTEGGYKCSCAEGYFLSQDNKRCKAVGGEATLIYLLPDQIRGIELVSHSHKVYVSSHWTDIRGMDYDALTGTVFWSEWGEGTIGSFAPESQKTDVILYERQRPYFLKWDWIGQNIYFTTSKGHIRACNRNGTYCTTVMETKVPHISSLELAPGSGLMFWSVYSVVLETGSGIIERSSMDGSGRIEIVNTKVSWPSSLAVDHVTKLLYWADIKLSAIECTDFNGLSRRTILKENLQYPHSIALFEDLIYIADWGTDRILHCNKITGGNCTELHRGDVKAEVISVVHTVQQPRGVNPCVNTCHQLCLLKPDGYSCACDEKFKASDFLCEKPPSTRDPKIRKKRRTKRTARDPEVCIDGFCLNGGTCKIIGGERHCWCDTPYTGKRCGEIHKTAKAGYTRDHSWIVAVLFGLVLAAGLLLTFLLRRRNKERLRKQSENVSVNFRNPMYSARKTGRLVTDTDDPVGDDELMLGKKGAYKALEFKNPLFCQPEQSCPLANTEEHIDGRCSGNIGEILVRCNNVLHIPGAEDEDSEME